MNFTNPLKRAAKALLGFGVGLALTTGAAVAQGAAPNIPNPFQNAFKGGGDGSVTGFYFHKTGAQKNCRYVEYDLRIAFEATPGFWDQPLAVNLMQKYRFSLRDQLPKGLKAVSATVAGDVTDFGGGAIAPTISTTIDPDDTVNLTDFRVSAADLNGDGSNTIRSLHLRILAEIDHATFPVPTLVDNQARLTASIGDIAMLLWSHDPALPDDGDFTTGDPTTISIDITDCPPPPPPPPPPGEGPCFEVEHGEVDCDPAGGGAFIYKMTVGADMAGETIELVSLTPGIVILPPSQVVPAGGGVLVWTILGASPGDHIELITTGVKYVGGPAEGVGLCCTQRIDIFIPEDLDCDPPETPRRSRIDINKVCQNVTTTGAGIPCRITVSNSGTAIPASPVVVNDTAFGLSGGAPVTILSVTPDGPAWGCSAVPADTLQCILPAIDLPPGASRHFDVVLAPTREGFKNCAHATSVAVIGGIPTSVQACDEGGVSNIGVKKTGDAVCEPGVPCNFQITFSNPGTAPFSGPVRIMDAMGIDGIGPIAGAPITVSPEFGCTPEPTTLPVNCVATMTLGAGESRSHTVTVTLPETGALTDIGANGLKGRNCVAALGPDVNAAMRGEIGEAVQGQANGADHFSCHPFQVLAEEEAPQCSAGMVANSDGNCVCPEGQTFTRGQCRGPQSTTPIPPRKPDPQQCRLLPGQVRTASGDCVCRSGTVLRGGRCAKPPVTTPPSCRIKGQFRNTRGQCVCPRGTKVINGQCRKPPVTTPPSCRVKGQLRNSRGQCYCPRGTKVINGACRKPPVTTPPSCRVKGQLRNSRGQCYCPRGTKVIRGACRKPPVTTPPSCRVKGQVRTRSGSCVCPKGQRVIRGACRRPSTGGGQTTNPGPSRVTPKNCKRGQIRVGNRCITRPVLKPNNRLIIKPQINRTLKLN